MNTSADKPIDIKNIVTGLSPLTVVFLAVFGAGLVVLAAAEAMRFYAGWAPRQALKSYDATVRETGSWETRRRLELMVQLDDVEEEVLRLEEAKGKAASGLEKQMVIRDTMAVVRKKYDLMKELKDFSDEKFYQVDADYTAREKIKLEERRAARKWLESCWKFEYLSLSLFILSGCGLAFQRMAGAEKKSPEGAQEGTDNSRKSQ